MVKYICYFILIIFKEPHMSLYITAIPIIISLIKKFIFYFYGLAFMTIISRDQSASVKFCSPLYIVIQSIN